MAQVTTVTTHDDLDGTPAAETVAFGASYEIDLSARNADKLRAALTAFVGRARNVRPAPAAPTQALHTREELDHMRTWAREAGWDVSDFGRIPGEIQRAYADAQAAGSSSGRRRRA